MLKKLLIALLVLVLLAVLGWLIYRAVVSYNPPPITAPEPVSACDGCDWTISDSDRTLTWTGPTDGSKDIHQGTNPSITAIRAGYTATFTTTVPGEIIITTGTVDGVAYITETRVHLDPGTHIVTNSVGESGGFRWTPDDGYGWRRD